MRRVVFRLVAISAVAFSVDRAAAQFPVNLDDRTGQFSCSCADGRLAGPFVWPTNMLFLFNRQNDLLSQATQEALRENFARARALEAEARGVMAQLQAADAAFKIQAAARCISACVKPADPTRVAPITPRAAPPAPPNRPPAPKPVLPPARAVDPGSVAGRATTRAGSPDPLRSGLGLVTATGSYFDLRVRELQLSAIQRRYVEQSRRDAAEALERQRLQRRLQMERQKQAARGSAPYADAGRAAGERLRAGIDRLRADLELGEDGLLKFQRDNIAFRKANPDAVTPPSMLSAPSVMRTADAVLVGGTGWVYGYNVPPGQEQLAAAARGNLEQQLSLAKVSRDQFPDPADYNMVIGVASAQDAVQDLMNRVIFGGPTGGGDQLSDGNFSADAQPLYASLRGTQTARLDCHSNGAMVCLAALSRGDVGAQDVRLFGPQLTPSAVAKWQELLDIGRIKSLEVNIMNGDPIAPASYAYGEAPMAYALTTLARAVQEGGNVLNLDAFSRDGALKLQADIQRTAASIHVNVLESSCLSQLSSDPFACHNMALYQQLTSR